MVIIVVEVMIVKFSTVMMVVGSTCVGGYLYMRKHPQMLSSMKKMVCDSARKVYNMLDED